MQEVALEHEEKNYCEVTEHMEEAAQRGSESPSLGLFKTALGEPALAGGWTGGSLEVTSSPSHTVVV